VKKIFLALALSIVLHTTVPLLEGVTERHGMSLKILDAILSLPAEACARILPAGHGIIQLVFPFLFSIGIYAAAFWLVIRFYPRPRRREAVRFPSPKAM